MLSATDSTDAHLLRAVFFHIQTTDHSAKKNIYPKATEVALASTCLVGVDMLSIRLLPNNDSPKNAIIVVVSNGLLRGY